MVYVVGITGGSGAGKSRFARAVAASVGSPRLGIMAQDWYYHDAPGADPTRYNFDAPQAFDMELLRQHLKQLKAGETVERPVYDYAGHRRLPRAEPFGPFEIILLEGILVLRDPVLLTLLDLRVYVDLPADLRLLRRLKRDVRERGRDLESVLAQYIQSVRPMHEAHVETCRSNADMIVPGDANDNHVDALAGRIGHRLRVLGG